MLITKTYRFIALTMALLLFVSSAGFSVDMHFCNDQLKGISLIGKAANCHEKASHCKNSKRACHKKNTNKSAAETAKDDCCNNERHILQMDADFVSVSADLVDINQADLDLLSAEVFYSSIPVIINSNKLEFYRPPPNLRDRQILYQTFLC